MLGRRHSRYPVFYDGAIVGLVTLPEVKEVDRADWPFVRTIDVTDRDIQALKVADRCARGVAPAAARGGSTRRTARGRRGRLVGIVTRADVIAALERSSSAVRRALLNARRRRVLSVLVTVVTIRAAPNRPAAIRGFEWTTQLQTQRIPAGRDRAPASVLQRVASICGATGSPRSPRHVSRELADVNAAQIRRDLAYFGQFGKRGVGYDIWLLIDRIQRILARITRTGSPSWRGQPWLGDSGVRRAARAGIRQWRRSSTTIRARSVNASATSSSRTWRSSTASSRQQGIRFGVIAVPPEAAQEVADRLARAGDRGHPQLLVRVRRACPRA